MKISWVVYILDIVHAPDVKNIINCSVGFTAMDKTVVFAYVNT